MFKGFHYAATQYRTQCFCGNSYDKYGAADNCDVKCAGDQSQTCGGGWANQVYDVRGHRKYVLRNPSFLPNF